MVQITRERAQIEIPKLSRKVKVFALGWGDSRWLDEDFEDVKTLTLRDNGVVSFDL